MVLTQPLFLKDEQRRHTNTWYGARPPSGMEFEIVAERVQLLLCEADQVQFLNSKNEIFDAERLHGLEDLADVYSQRLDRGLEVFVNYFQAFLTRRNPKTALERTVLYQRFCQYRG